MIKKINFFVYVLCCAAFSVLALGNQNVSFASTDIMLDTQVYHSGSGQGEICIKAEGEEVCEDINLIQRPNPFFLHTPVSGVEQGGDFEVCYEFDDGDQQGCDEFEFSGNNPQPVAITVPPIGSSSDDNIENTEGGLDSSSIPPIQLQQQDEGEQAEAPQQQQQPSLPPQPQSAPPAQQQQVTWQTFTGRNNLFTIQYPSNWVVATDWETSNPIDVLFQYQDNVNGTPRLVTLNVLKSQIQSMFSDSYNSTLNLESSSQNTVEGFNSEEPVECSKYQINGIMACSFIGSFTPSGTTAKMMNFDAVDSDGTEYQAVYMAPPELFDHFLPVVEEMVKSFRITN